jgi:hypothetical protein
MSKLADPSVCPDCRAPLDATATCTGCGLPLAGPGGERLWRTMLGADRLVEEIRAASLVPAPVTVGGGDRAPAPGRLGGATGGLPPAPPSSRSIPEPGPRRLPAASVPAVLLSLGALCLLVAAGVFVAIAWGHLGIAGRTLVLGGVTGVLGGVATVCTRRGLRGAAESLWSVVSGMLVLDLLGARSAGLADLEALGWRSTSVLVGLVLVALGVSVALWSRRTPTRAVWAAQVVVVLGAIAASAGAGWFAVNPAVGTAVVTPVLVLAGLALRRHLPVVGAAVLVLAVLTWLELAAIGTGRADELVSWSSWWGDVRGWPLLVAALWAGLAALAPRPHLVARSLLAAAALASLAVLANGPAPTGSETRDLLVAAATLVVLSAVARWAPRAWSLAGGSLAALGAAALTIELAWQPWSAIDLLPADGRPSMRLDAVEAVAAPWTWGLAGLGVAVVALASAPLLPTRRPRDLGRAVAAAALAGGLVVAVAADRPPLWAAVSAALTGAALVAGLAWVRRSAWTPAALVAGAVGAGYLVLLGLGAALASTQVAAVAGTAVALVLLGAFADGQRRDGTLAPALAGGLGVLAGSYALPAWGSLLSAAPDVTAAVVAAYAAGVAVLAALVSRRTASRVTLELTTLVPALLAAVLAPDLRSLAMVLTVLGTGAAGVSVLNRDRSAVSWLAAVVLGSATLLRVSLDVRAPELYTLPAALLLVGAGLWRLRADRSSSSADSLGAGLALALVPSLLLALEEPASLRGLLVGAAAALTLALGVRQRLSAPLMAGAATIALLAARELEPLADAVPRWVSLALLGVALLGVGISWEARLRNLRAAGHYVTALR